MKEAASKREIYQKKNAIIEIVKKLNDAESLKLIYEFALCHYIKNENEKN